LLKGVKLHELQSSNPHAAFPDAAQNGRNPGEMNGGTVP
jgi:hypothetical protein